MNVKVIVAAIGGAAYGAFVAWAVVSDRNEVIAVEQAENEQIRRSVLRRQMQELSTDLIKARQAENELRERLAAYESVELPVETPTYVESDPEKSPGDDSAETDVTHETDGRAPKRLEDVEDWDDLEVEKGRARIQGLLDTYRTRTEPSADEAAINRQAMFVNDKEPPFVITRSEFSNSEESPTDYDKITITYYPNDRIVLDEEEDVMENVANDLGWANLRQFGGESGDPDTVFIRNHRLQVDFEVVREDEDTPLPIHVRYGMGKDEFTLAKAAGVLKLRPEDLD